MLGKLIVKKLATFSQTTVHFFCSFTFTEEKVALWLGFKLTFLVCMCVVCVRVSFYRRHKQAIRLSK